jgi:branched-chain amino acid transport system substrate-binding protein
LAEQRDVAGIVGYLGTGARFTTAAAARGELPLVNCADTVPTADELLNPWIFRCRGEDPRRCRLVLDHLLDHLGCARLAVLRAPSAGAAPPLDWWTSHAETRGHPIVLDVTCDVRAADPASVLAVLREAGADAVLTWGDAGWSASLIRAMRSAGLQQPVVGGPGMLDDEFAALAGAEHGPVIAVLPAGSAVRREAAARFVEAYEARFRRRPDAGAHLLYETVNHLIEAIQVAGLDRDEVASALGRMGLDAGGEAHAERWPPDPDEILMGRLHNGRWDFLAVSDLLAPAPTN